MKNNSAFDIVSPGRAEKVLQPIGIDELSEEQVLYLSFWQE